MLLLPVCFLIIKQDRIPFFPQEATVGCEREEYENLSYTGTHREVSG